MGWKRIRVMCEPAQPGHEIATAWLSEAGCSMFDETSRGLHAYARAEELDILLAKACQRDLDPLGLKEWELSDVEEENWNAQWETDYPEVHMGDRIRIRAPFHPENSETSFEHTLTIQPRMAFGTGHHGTTYGLLAEMVDMDWKGCAVLDMGCGSGVLGIHASMRGAPYVLCVDIDPWSVTNTRENASLNGVSEGPAFEVREGGASVLEKSDEGRFDVVIANINRNILLEDMEAYCKVLKPSGTLMLSGFMEPDVPSLVDCAAAFGLELSSAHEEQEWRILTLRR